MAAGTGWTYVEYDGYNSREGDGFREVSGDHGMQDEKWKKEHLQFNGSVP